MSTAAAAGAPGLGVRPWEPPRALSGRGWARNKHQQHPTSVHKVTHREMGAQGRRGTAPACGPPGPALRPVPQWQCLQRGTCTAAGRSSFPTSLPPRGQLPLPTEQDQRGVRPGLHSWTLQPRSPAGVGWGFPCKEPPAPQLTHCQYCSGS